MADSEMCLSEAQLERLRLECLFCLGGGELYDEPWGSARYWYEDSPEYAKSEFTAEHHSYRTILANVMFGPPDSPETGWELVQTFLSSGERECWNCGHGTDWDGSDEQEKAMETCELCEGDGYIYLGDGWAELVYRAHDSILWPEDWDACEDCEALTDNATASYPDGYDKSPVYSWQCETCEQEEEEETDG